MRKPNKSKFKLDPAVFDLSTEAEPSEPWRFDPAKLQDPGPEYSHYRFAPPGSGSGVPLWLPEPPEEPGVELCAAFIELAQNAAAAAGWPTYTMADGRVGAVRSERAVLDSPHIGPLEGKAEARVRQLRIRGSQEAAQRLYLCFAKEARQRGDGDAAEDVRRCIGAPSVLTRKPHNVRCEIQDLGPYYWVEGISEALRKFDPEQKTKDTPYRDLWRTAQGILWNLTRDEDQELQLRRRTEVLLDHDKIDKWVKLWRDRKQLEMFGEVDAALSRLPPELKRFLHAAGEAFTLEKRRRGHKTISLDRDALASRYPEMRLDFLLRMVEHKYAADLDQMGESLGGYVIEHRVHKKDGFHPKRPKLFDI